MSSSAATVIVLCASYEDGWSAREGYTECMKHTQGNCYDFKKLLSDKHEVTQYEIQPSLSS